MKSALLAMNCELRAVVDETNLLKELKSQSDYPGRITLPWLKSELAQFFTAKGPKGGPIIMTQVQLQNKYCSNTDTIFRLRMNTELLGTTISLETLLTCTN